jgi:hypothetical protein
VSRRRAFDRTLELPLALSTGVALLLALDACSADTSARSPAEPATSVGNLRRPPGMPIGTGASGGELDDPEAKDEEAAASPADLTNNADLSIPKFVAPAPGPVSAPVPCSGCVELNVDVNDINQRDEFVFAAGGTPVTRVVWTIRVNFNSDQLAVQPFIDTQHGKYTNLHVNTFPLGAPVPVEQEFSGRARTIGLVVGSSGAWTGNQTMSVFVDSVSVEGSPSRTLSFESDAEGLAPRTSAHNPKLVLHPER